MIREVGIKSNGDDFGGMELISLVTSLDSTGRRCQTQPENRGSGIGGAVKVEASLATVCFRVPFSMTLNDPNPDFNVRPFFDADKEMDRPVA